MATGKVTRIPEIIATKQTLTFSSAGAASYSNTKITANSIVTASVVTSTPTSATITVNPVSGKVNFYGYVPASSAVLTGSITLMIIIVNN